MNKRIFLGKEINQIKASNLSKVLLAFLSDDPVYRVDLAKKFSLSQTTITKLTDELIKFGIIAEYGTEEILEQRGAGRPRTILRLLPDARYAIGVHIGIGTYRIAITNLKGEIRCSEVKNFDLGNSPYDVLLDIVNGINHCIEVNKINRSFIIGIGVGASALVDHNQGVNILAPRLGWKNVPIKRILSDQLELPVVVDNNVRAMALGEGFFGKGFGASPLIFIYGRVGIGAGIIINNQILRGNSYGAGEIGHFVMIPEGGKFCHCGKRGCLETLVSEAEILNQAQDLVDKNPDSILASCLRRNEIENPVERVYLAAREGDILAQGIIDNCGYFLGLIIADLVNLLDPELIILGGMFYECQDLILPKTQEVIKEKSFTKEGQRIQVEISQFGWQASMVGAAALALIKFFYLLDH
jgi:glucokinase-like ROK family protein